MEIEGNTSLIGEWETLSTIIPTVHGTAFCGLNIDKNPAKVKYLRCGTIDVWLVHLNCIMFQSKNIVRENNGFVPSSLMVSYQILRATELAGVHHIQQLEDTSICLVK